MRGDSKCLWHGFKIWIDVFTALKLANLSHYSVTGLWALVKRGKKGLSGKRISPWKHTWHVKLKTQTLRAWVFPSHSRQPGKRGGSLSSCTDWSAENCSWYEVTVFVVKMCLEVRGETSYREKLICFQWTSTPVESKIFYCSSPFSGPSLLFRQLDTSVMSHVVSFEHSFRHLLHDMAMLLFIVHC